MLWADFGMDFRTVSGPAPTLRSPRITAIIFSLAKLPYFERFAIGHCYTALCDFLSSKFLLFGDNELTLATPG
jgi:hypothetical protein